MVEEGEEEEQAEKGWCHYKGEERRKRTRQTQ
jgi:hypothetical protein